MSMSARRAYTFIEITIVMVVAAILAVVAFSDSKSAADEEGMSAAVMFESDVEFARAGSIARPDDPIVIKLDAVNEKYWLANKSDEDTPILHPVSGKPYVVRFGPGGKAGVRSVSIHACDFGGDDVISFDGMGNLDQATPAVVQFSSGTARYEVSVAPASANCTIHREFTMTLDQPAEGGGSIGAGSGGSLTDGESIGEPTIPQVPL